MHGEDDERRGARRGRRRVSDFEREDGEGPPAEPGQDGHARLRKAPTAFRTISEVADELHIPQHVLRFWETRFPQVKPLKRGGGRRYYRPDDIALLRSISHLLYIQGYTIKGVQRLLREGGGALADDIPPASDAERLEADANGRVRLPPGDSRRPIRCRDCRRTPRRIAARAVLRSWCWPSSRRSGALIPG